MEDMYTANGYDNREAYLKSLADDFNIDIGIVTMISDLLGSTEDFDGLVSSLEDYDEGIGYD